MSERVEVALKMLEHNLSPIELIDLHGELLKVISKQGVARELVQQYTGLPEEKDAEGT